MDFMISSCPAREKPRPRLLLYLFYNCLDG